MMKLPSAPTRRALVFILPRSQDTLVTDENPSSACVNSLRGQLLYGNDYVDRGARGYFSILGEFWGVRYVYLITRFLNKHRIHDIRYSKAHFALTLCLPLCTSTYQTLHWRHNGHDDVSNHQPHDCLLNRLLRRRSKKTSKLRVTDLCAGNSPETGEFPAQMASNAENVSIWWRHHEISSDWKS